MLLSHETSSWPNRCRSWCYPRGKECIVITNHINVAVTPRQPFFRLQPGISHHHHPSSLSEVVTHCHARRSQSSQRQNTFIHIRAWDNLRVLPIRAQLIISCTNVGPSHALSPHLSHSLSIFIWENAVQTDWVTQQRTTWAHVVLSCFSVRWMNGSGRTLKTMCEQVFALSALWPEG